MSGEAEPRRSVRSTKGQHKALEALEQPIEPKRRGKKAAPKKQANPEPEEEEEIIRCVCGKTDQDGEAEDEPWISCDSCHAWQHNVCVGMSVYGEDLEGKDYYCEECRPEDHKELLEAMARGEHPWEARRQAYEEEKAAEEAEKKKKKGTKKGKKRQSDLPQEEPRSSQKSVKSSASPAPEKMTAIAKNAAGKRKERHDSADTAAKEPSKLRKVSESEAVPVPVPVPVPVSVPVSVPAQYEPPNDLPSAVTELLDWRQGPAKLLQKGLVQAINAHEKNGGYNPADGVSNESRAERLALAVERAVFDSHPNRTDYIQQARTISANLKTNSELIVRLLDHSLTPPVLAVMTSDELQSKKQQEETAAAKERSVRQSMIATEEPQNVPRYRRTHKGDELIEGDSFVGSNEGTSFQQRQGARDAPAQPSKAGGPARTTSQGPASHSRKSSGEPMRIDTQQSPNNEFDINKVFSSVKSPTAAQSRRPSAPIPPQGPGVDPDVDRLLQEDGIETPPYSPSEETDPDIVWNGHITMTSVASFRAKAKHIGGANLANTIGLPWTKLLPKELTLGGRIPIDTATVYLCGLRWSNVCDLVVATLTPADESERADFDRIFKYFVSKERWGVVGEKGVGNVKDTYLIPVPAGTGNHPEFILNLEDNFLPQTRNEDILLLAIVYRNDEETMARLYGPDWQNRHTGPIEPEPEPEPEKQNATPTPVLSTVAHQRSTSVPGPVFSPTTPHVGPGGFPPPQSGPNGLGHPAVQGQRHLQQQNQAFTTPHDVSRELQEEGIARATSILGPHMGAATLTFLMPHAASMQPSEWQIIRGIFDRDSRAKDDLGLLGHLIKEEGNRSAQQAPQQAPQYGQQHTPVQVPRPQPARAAPTHAIIPGASPPRPPQPIPPQRERNSNASTPIPPAVVHPVPPMPQPPQQSQPPPPPVQVRQTPVALPRIPGMPDSVHQSHQQAQAQPHARNMQSPPGGGPATNTA